ncbi:thioredoxin domain-containing protein [Thermogutta sp.]|uniref:thioredoxin domain-containing protein n=1 Tax=Thermogutta sp. TaxID=1962930 RepID=UPI00322003C7
MPNRLIFSKSPYLRQHAENPVDWYPWGEEAFRKAKELDRPIFLSIGYSACHWCHVMERESFSDPEIADFLNRHFVSIKVDREEHPAVDAQYMEAVQLLTGRGGWPLTVFLTPDLQPFYGGTYFPPRARGGMPGFLDVLRAVADAWQNRRDEVVGQADKLTILVSDIAGTLAGRADKPESAIADLAERALAQGFDSRWGGFGAAPKFPHPSLLRFLLLRYATASSQVALFMALKTLDSMAAGGIHDHIGGGFHRYSTDAQWLVPHFEKMLYDNALLARAYLDAFRLTERPLYEAVTRQTLDYLLRDMAHPGGGFYSSEDADSEGEEGKFYLWDFQEIREILGHRADLFTEYYDIRREGNFEGRNIPNLIASQDRLEQLNAQERENIERELATCREILFQARNRRVRPGRDDKILLNWNAFTVDTLFWAGRALGESRYHEAARQTLDFLLATFWSNGHLFHSWCDGELQGPAVLDDYAALSVALLSGYETTANATYLEHVYRLAERILEQFRDPQSGAFFMTTPDHPHLLCRQLDYFDNPTPSGTALTVELLLRLGHLLGETRFLAQAEQALAGLSGWMQRAPMGVGHALLCLQTLAVGWTSWVFCLRGTPQLSGELPHFVHEYFRRYIPASVTAMDGANEHPAGSLHERIFHDREPIDGQATLYLCQGSQCRPPVVGDTAIRNAILSRSVLVPKAQAEAG